MQSDVILEGQIADTLIRVEAGDAGFRAAFARYLNSAWHGCAPAHEIVLTVTRDGDAYVLPSGRREYSREVAAEALWAEAEQHLQERLAPWLQVAGVVLDHQGRRILVLGEERTVLQALALHSMWQGLDVCSASGVCIRDGLSVPVARGAEIPRSELQRFRAATGCTAAGREWRDEMGLCTACFTPQDFGRAWQVTPRPIDALVLLAWNPGGWSGLGKRQAPAALETILDAVHLPAALAVPARLPLIAQATALAGRTPAWDLRLGRVADAPRLLVDLPAASPPRG